MPSLEEVLRYQVKQQAKNDPLVQQHWRAQSALGQKMSELTADPRWEIYGRALEQAKEIHERRIEAADQTLLGEFLDTVNYGKVKVARAYAEGYAKALAFALTAAKELIEQGEKATEELKKHVRDSA